MFRPVPRKVIAIELLSAAHGLWWRQAENSSETFGAGSAAALAVIEEALGGKGGEHVPSDDIIALDAVIGDGTLVDAVLAAVGGLRGIDDV